jgi:hypothetical protein
MKIAAFGLIAGLAALGGGCATEFVYLPVGPGATGAPAAQYAIPPTKPQGEAYVTSFGFTDVETGSQRGPLLHVRLAVANGSTAAWTVDASQQRLLAPGQPVRTPSFLNTDAVGSWPTYQVAPGRANVFDLYYSVPPVAGPSELGSFSLDWRVNAGGQLLAETTSFQRFEQEPAGSYADYPPYVTVGLGFGVGWWGAPLFLDGGFSPLVRGYYYPPHRVHGGPWHGPRPGGWHAGPPSGGWGHGGPHGGFHGGGHGAGFHGGGHR